MIDSIFSDGRLGGSPQEIARAHSNSYLNKTPSKIKDVYFFELNLDRFAIKKDINLEEIKKENQGLMVETIDNSGVKYACAIIGAKNISRFFMYNKLLVDELSTLKGKDIGVYSSANLWFGIDMDLD